MNALRRVLPIALALAVASRLGTVAFADTLTGDLNHSGAEFVVTHLSISHVHGTIPVSAWSATTGPGDIPTGLTATLDARAIDTKSSDRDSDLRGADWLDVAKYPTITFKSTSVQPGQNGAFKLNGELTLHGVTKPVTLDGKVEGSIVDSHGRKHIGYSATTTIDRRDFGLNWGKTTPGGVFIAANDVAITINAEAIVAK
jgi:polyisoprenoid-binding protein YceI